MKKILYLTIIFCCVLAMPVMAVMRSNLINDNAVQNNKSDLFRPMYATNIKIAKKIPASLGIKEIKGRSDVPPGKNKEDDPSEGVAAGVLGTATGSKYAVVIGICDYPEGETVSDICLSDGDSFYMVRALIENYGYSPNHIYWFRDMGGVIDIGGTEMNYKVPSYNNIRDAIIGTEEGVGGIINKVLSADEVVFFFSGHGASGDIDDYDEEPIDEGIMVHNGNNVEVIWDEELRNWFDGFVNTRIVFIFDTCLAGGMNDVVDDGRIVVMSSKETQSSSVYSSGEFGEGMFSHYFVNKGILQGLADIYDHENNGVLEEGKDVVIEEAFDYVKENIPSYLKFRQNPVINDSFENDLLLGYNLDSTDN